MSSRLDLTPPAAGGATRGERGQSSPPAPSPTSPFLTVRDVGKQYGDVHAVDGVSFHQGTGEILALLGPNGAGKTTLVRMLVRITRPDRGSITFRWDGHEHPALPARLLGYLPEERGLYTDRRVDETLEFLAALRGVRRPLPRERLHQWLARTGLDGHASTRIGALSKGNQQKVQLIAALLHAPRFAVLDEPFSGLDPLNQQLTLDLIRRVRDEGATVLLSAHQMELVERIADRVILLHHGRPLLAGTLAELRGAPGSGGRSLHDVYVDAVRGASAVGGAP